MKVWKVPDMHCEKCVERIDKAMAAANIAATVDLTAKTVTVDEAQAAAAAEALDDLGFAVTDSPA